MKRVLKQVWLKSLVVFICLSGLSQSSLATTVIVPPDDHMIIGARAIVRGKVLSVGSAFDEQHRIFTYITLRVQEVIKGQITSRKIVIKEEGGQVGEEGSIVFGIPEYKPGEKVLVYLDTRADGSLRTHQMFLGKFSVIRNPETGKYDVVRAAPDKYVTVLEAASHDHQESGPSTNRMELSDYLQMVRSRLTANWDRAQAFEQKHYGDSPLLTKPVEYDQLFSKGDIHPQWAFIHANHPRWFEPDTNQPVLFSINPAGAPNSQIIGDVTAAMNAWSTVPGCALRVATGPDTTACNPTFGLNTIIFNACDGRWSTTPGCAGTLALGGLSWTGETRVINGVTYRRGTHGFISFNPNASCHFGNSCNVREITTHELGHALGLGHSEFSDATMAAFAHFDGRCASIRPDDVAGITTIYPGTGGGPGPLTITTATLPNATAQSPYSQTLAASGGTSPYTWSVTTGAASLPTGITLAPTGLLSGIPTTQGTYNFTVQVADSASPQVTAQKALTIVVNAAGTQLNSQFVSQSVPATLTPGQQFTVNLKWTNTGTETWGGSPSYLVRSQNPPNNVTWGGNAVSLNGFSVTQGQTLDLTFLATAPSTAGTYNFQWQLAKDGVFYGQMSTNVAVTVSNGGGGTDNASFVSQSAPSTMTAGQSAAVSVTMQNTGTTTWSAGTYKLGSQNPQDNNTWGLNRVNLASSVAPGGQATFSFNVTAPAAGSYNFQWRMLQDGTGFFGSSSTNVSVTVSSSGGGGSNNAAFFSQSVPTLMDPGQVVLITVSMRNTGTTTWSSATGYKLGSQNPQDNMTWGVNRANLPKSIPPSGVAAFRFAVVAPSTPGVYNLQWQVCKDGTGFFGETSTNVSIQVGNGGGGGGGTDNASFVSQSAPSTMTAGQSAAVSVTMQNTGTTTWSAGTYKLGSQNPQDNNTWGLNRVNLASSVAPGGQATFSFNITAPGAAGTYNFQWRMLQDGTGFFGSSSTNVSVTVSSGGGGGTNNASFVSQSAPSTMTAGQSAAVSVTMQNTGTTTWSAGTYKLGSQNPQDNNTWGLNRVNLASSVAPGGQATFSFNITAPGAAGSYNFQWRMLQDSVGFFGSSSTNVAVNVTASSTPLVLVTTSLPGGVRAVSYSHQLVATGGASPYNWSVTGGVLPAGISLDPNTGLLSGMTTQGGTFNIIITVRDQNNASASRTYKFSIR